MNKLSRREFVVMAGATLAVGKLAAAPQGKITAGEVVDRVKKNLGIPWIETSRRDTFKVGGPETPVTGIATCFGTNLRVMQLAVKAGLNMIVTHEPTFYSDYDVIDWVKDDPVYKMKLDFATKNNMAVWRIHDDWHARKPDGIRTGWDNAIGWNKYKDSDATKSTYTLPPTTVGDLAKYVAKTLDSRSVRVMGDPNLRVVKVAHGGHQPEQNMAAMQLPGVDCIIVSETKEYDSFEYVRDAIRTGTKKGAIFVSHVTGEDEGMRFFAEWSQPFLPEIPVKYIATTDEYWTV